jgi:hypothetical protein
MAWDFGREGVRDAQTHAMDAQGAFRDGEAPVVTAARGIVRDHERDPVDGTMRTFGGRDEARLQSAISRIDPNVTDVAHIGGVLSADVAIQAMAATRIRHIESGRDGPTAYDAKDLRAVRGDSTGIEAMGRVELGNVMTGNHDRIGTAASNWIEDTKSFVGRQAAIEGRPMGEGSRMAMAGGFARSAETRLAQSQIDAYRDHGFVPRPSANPGGLAAQAAGLGSPRSPTPAVGPSDRGVDLAAAHIARDGSKGR